MAFYEKSKVRCGGIGIVLFVILLLFLFYKLDIKTFATNGPFVKYTITETDGGMSREEFETVTIAIDTKGEGTYSIYNHESGRNYTAAFQIDESIIQAIQDEIIRMDFANLDENLSVTDAFHGTEKCLTVYYYKGSHTSGGLNPDNKQFNMICRTVMNSIPIDIDVSAEKIENEFSATDYLVLTIPEQLAQYKNTIADEGFYATDKNETLYFVLYADTASLKNADSVSVFFDNIEKNHEFPDGSQPVYTVTATSVEKRSKAMESDASYSYELVCRKNLTLEQRNLYDTYLPKLINMQPIQIETHTIMTAQQAIDIQEVLLAITKDNPDIESYFDPYKSIFENNGLLLYQCQWDLNLYDNEDINAGVEKMRQIADDLVNNMPKELSTYDKYLFLAKELCEITQYDEDVTNIGRLAYGALVNGSSNCRGYTLAYQYLCMRAGLWCKMVVSENHAWNLIKLETGTYHVDVTWADTYEPYSREWSKYICMSQQEVISLEDHVIVDGTVADGIPF